MWSAALSESGLPTTDVASALADLLSVKDENEIINVKKAAFMTASVMKQSTVPRLEGKYSSCSQCQSQHISPRSHDTAIACWSRQWLMLLTAGRTGCFLSVVDTNIGLTLQSSSDQSMYPIGIIDAEKKVKHSKLSEEIEQVLSEPSKIHVKLNPQNLDIAYAPIVQSGGQYDLKVSAASDERRLEYDVILCSLGARYSMYCANIGRTFLVDPVKQQEEEYKALLQAQDAALNALVPGAPMSAAVTATIKALQVKMSSFNLHHSCKNSGSCVLTASLWHQNWR